MAVMPPAADVDTAVPAAGTPNRSLTNTFLKALRAAALTRDAIPDASGARTLGATEDGVPLDVTNTTANAIAINTASNGLSYVITWPATAAPPVITPTGVTLNGGSTAITGAAGPGAIIIQPIGTNAFRVVGSIRQGVPRTLTGAASFVPDDLNVTTNFNSASTAALTIPDDATLGARPGDAVLTVFVQGAGVPTFAAGIGVTIVGTPRAGLAQNDTIVLNHTVSANTWSYV